jgi:hypothetical protein
MSLETVLYDLHDGIARIRINRPHRLNAMVSIGLAEPLVARGNPSARVVIHIEGRVAEMQLSDFAARDTRDAIRLGEWRVRPRAPAGARPRDAEQPCSTR